MTHWFEGADLIYYMMHTHTCIVTAVTENDELYPITTYLPYGVINALCPSADYLYVAQRNKPYEVINLVTLAKIDIRTLKKVTDVPIKQVTEEFWNPIQGYPHYLVSNYGRVKSLHRDSDHIMTQKVDFSGHLRVSVMENYTRSDLYLSTIIAFAFLEPNPTKTFVDYLDHDCKNLRLSNLIWTNRSDLVTKYVDHGSWKNAKLIKIVETDEIYPSIAACARKIGVNRNSVVACLKRKNGTCHGYHIKLVKKRGKK